MVKRPYESFLPSECPSINRRTVERLYRVYRRQLFRYGMQITADESLVGDAVQEVFLRMLQRVDRLIEINDLKTYLFVALKNRLVKEAVTLKSHRRHQLRYARGLSTTEELSYPERAPDQSWKVRLCLDAINQLPAGARDILHMRYLEGYDYKEIAAITRRNHQVTRNYASKAIKEVRMKIRGE